MNCCHLIFHKSDFATWSMIVDKSRLYIEIIIYNIAILVVKKLHTDHDGPFLSFFGWYALVCGVLEHDL